MQGDWQLVAAFQSARELGGQHRHFAVAAVHVQRLAHDGQAGRPFGDNAFEFFPIGYAVAGAQRSEGLASAGLPVADGYADMAQPKIKCKNRVSQACPASAEIKFMSMPNFAAAVRMRKWKGVSKMMALSAGRVSQLFLVSSSSSCPASQPA